MIPLLASAVKPLGQDTEPPPVAAVVWVDPSGNLIPPDVDSMVPATVSFWPGVVVPIPTLPLNEIAPLLLVQ